MENDGLDIPKMARKKPIQTETLLETSQENTKTSVPPKPIKQADKIEKKPKESSTQKPTQRKKKVVQSSEKQTTAITKSSQEEFSAQQVKPTPSTIKDQKEEPIKKKRTKKTTSSPDNPQPPHKSTAERSAELKKKFNEIAEREKKKINASNRNFMIFITKLFLILMAAGGLFMFLVYNGLQAYEKNTPNGAMMQYVTLLRQEKYDKIYDNSTKGFTQLNNKEDYIGYLKGIYGDTDLKNAVFSKKAYSNSTFLYYDLIVDGTTLSTLELLYLSEDQRWIPRTVVSSRNFYLDLVGDASVSVNGVQLDNTYRTEENVVAKNYENLYDMDLAPKVSRYHIDNLVSIPEITTQDNETYKVVKDATSDQFYVGYACDEEFLATATNLIRNAATTYARYVSADAKFTELRALLYRRSDFYKTISEFNNRFFTTHDSFRFDKVEVSDIVSFGEETGFIGTISFDYTVSIDKGEISKTYANTYQLTFLNVSGKWLCSNIAIASQQEQ